MVRNSIQSRECSMDSAYDGGLHKMFVVNANRNDGQWNVNTNELDNDNQWNAENRLFLRNTFISPDYAREFLLSINFFHPDNSLPIPFNFSDRWMYVFSFRCSFSQDICRKNLIRSYFAIVSVRFFCFSSSLAKVARNSPSKMSINKVSILAPKPKRNGLERCAAILCHSR